METSTMDITKDGYGYGYGYGYGDGSGYGYGDGYGSGYKIIIPENYGFYAYHYICKEEVGKYIMRNGKSISIGEIIQENEIELCKCGLHASMSKRDAEKWRRENSVLTKVKIWGRVNFDNDKLVATHRQIVEEIKEPYNII